MSPRPSRLIAAGLLALGLAVAPAAAQAPEPPQPEVLARGPVHEAYAATTEHQTTMPVVPKQPPELIEELPPDQKPAGENVVWIPGYWHYDEERTDYIWVSGFWRVPPPGRVWVPGSWRDVRGGWQWTHGFWQDVQAGQPAELEYLPPPPAPIEVAPSVPAPADTHTYVPGCWVWRSHRYVWRPGVWVEHRPGWIWTPAHYRWTPVGHVFVDGYWDYPLADRGVLFAPVYVPPAVYARPAYVYSPTIIVREPVLYTSLFVRRGWGCYYFGDYFEARYVNTGYSAWCGTYRNNGFAISVGFGRGWHHDPLWSYYRHHHRHDHGWANDINHVYAGRFNGSVPRPPRTLVQQNVVVNNITNNTVVNNTVVNKNVNNVTMLTPLKTATAADQRLVLKPVAQDERFREQKVAADLRAVAAERKKLEARLVDQSPPPVGSPGKPAPVVTPRSVKLDVPKQVVARAQVPADKSGKAPPPAPITLKPQPAPGPAPGVTPVVPGSGPKPLPPPTQPKGTTIPPPKGDPKPLPPVSPP
jgi:hypothetical protein